MRSMTAMLKSFLYYLTIAAAFMVGTLLALMCFFLLYYYDPGVHFGIAVKDEFKEELGRLAAAFLILLVTCLLGMAAFLGLTYLIIRTKASASV